VYLDEKMGFEVVIMANVTCGQLPVVVVWRDIVILFELWRNGGFRIN
jgi:hypothetical protein